MEHAWTTLILAVTRVFVKLDTSERIAKQVGKKINRLLFKKRNNKRQYKETENTMTNILSKIGVMLEGKSEKYINDILAEKEKEAEWEI